MSISLVLLLANCASCWFMTGLIWFVQVVHYPLFVGVGREQFSGYHRVHTRSTTVVVLPPMMVEMVSAVLLVVYPPVTLSFPFFLAALALLALVWLSTFGLQVPRHNELSSGFDENSVLRLCRTNWIRTILWSCRALMLFWPISRLLAKGGTV